MLIDCPGCARSYHISRATLGPQGRRLACPHCLTSWFATAEAQGIADRDFEETTDSAAPLEDPPLEITAEAFSGRSQAPSYDELYGSAPKPPVAVGKSHGLPRPSRAAILTIAALGLLMGGIAARKTIVQIWPKSNALYAAAGFPVNTRGLDLQHLKVNLVRDGAQPLLLVDGEIANQRDEKASVPELRLTVRDAAGQDIYSWDVISPKAKLEGGETITFRARLAAPPPDGHEVFVRFAAAEPKTSR